jgi:hypothetical protein
MYAERIGECNLMYCTKSVHLLGLKIIFVPFQRFLPLENIKMASFWI